MDKLTIEVIWEMAQSGMKHLPVARAFKNNQEIESETLEENAIDLNEFARKNGFSLEEYMEAEVIKGLLRKLYPKPCAFILK
jgi:hypothetical protein